MERDNALSSQNDRKSQVCLENVYFDIAGIDVSKISEYHVARLLTKIAVGAVTVWWSLLELRNIYNIRKAVGGE